ncbi:MAG: protein-export chaperone SecB [Armatimonadetes bacterium]|nr:protein-export chaperone SecB [Armatimonadota bacterium]
MDKKKQPGISFDSIILAKEKFWRNPSLPKELNINLDFKVKRSIENEKGIIELDTFLSLQDSEKVKHVKLELKYVGLFSIIESEKNMELEHFLENNAPALLVPYIREQISSITSKAGILPVILPPLNILAIIKEKEKK